MPPAEPALLTPDEWKFWTAIAVALLSAALSGIIAYWKGGRDFKLRLEGMKAEQALTEQQQLRRELKKYSGLILLSASDLQDRLWHLVRRQAKSDKPVLLNEDLAQPAYPAWPMTRQHYLTGTVYLFARYWCWVEILNHTIRYLDFGSEEKTKAFRAIVKRAERALAETELQKAAGSKVRADRPIFQLQQAVMGQSLMREMGDTLDCLNFAAFTEAYPDLRSRFPDFKDLEALLVGAMKPAESDFHLQRLTIFANSLVAIIDFLDPEQNLVPAEEREYLPYSGVKPAQIEEILGPGG